MTAPPSHGGGRRSGDAPGARPARTVTDEAIDDDQAARSSPAGWPPATGCRRRRTCRSSSGCRAARCGRRSGALALLRVLDVRHGDGTYVSSLHPELLVGRARVRRRPAAGPHPARGLRAAPRAGAGRRRRSRRSGSPTQELRRGRALPAGDGAGERPRGLRGAGPGVPRPARPRLRQRRAGRRWPAASRLQTVRVRVWRLAAVDGVLEWTRRQHEAVFRAVSARDPALALAAATAHVAEAEAWLRQHLAPAEDPAAPGPSRPRARPRARAVDRPRTDSSDLSVGRPADQTSHQTSDECLTSARTGPYGARDAPHVTQVT